MLRMEKVVIAIDHQVIKRGDNKQGQSPNVLIKILKYNHRWTDVHCYVRKSGMVQPQDFSYLTSQNDFIEIMVYKYTIMEIYKKFSITA